MQPEPLFPVSLKLKGRTCLILGGGPIALAKLTPLLDTGAQIRVIDPAPLPEVTDLAKAGRIALEAGPLAPHHCGGITLAIDSGEYADGTALLRREAEKRNILLNSVDQPDACDYFTPAVVRRGPIQVAISTGGAAPALARTLRQMLDRLMPASLGDLAQKAADMRAHVQATMSPARQKSFWNTLFSMSAIRSLAASSADTLIEQAMTAAPPAGHVMLVGAGAGAADMITLRGLRALEEADVILHDALLDPALLRHARRDARIMAVGKRCGKHSTTQDFINKTLENFARQGKQVVRLKCGDPFIFGRGGEELFHLQEADIPVTVIPGVTAASVAAAEYGFPLTHRGVARRTTFMTAATNKSLPADKANWDALLQGGTIVLYMAKAGLEVTLAAMRDAGINSTMPIAVVSDAGRTTSDRKAGSLGSFLASPPELGDAPALVAIGEAVGLAANAVAEYKDDLQRYYR
ncbi:MULTISPECIES: siroheme synthase CysG [Kordiimonas]|jgi:uroporphyrin-III C-methyltransferase/precorrin-2 dehydrogenase/sirohydrochlorin ferrochelatase|uniref:siroheme synthase CysG n=1 Tax=Kordiimonas TaxID=288021 RepID=UPI00257C20E7|nr:siroheme synthase CysG [Kordiimonas sp. UBA4487]